jgi:hypothetical protein
MESTNQSTDQPTDQPYNAYLTADFVHDLVSKWPEQRRISFLREMQSRFDSDAAASATLGPTVQQPNYGGFSATGVEITEPTSGLSNVSQVASHADELSSQGGITRVDALNFSPRIPATNATLFSIDCVDR